MRKQNAIGNWGGLLNKGQNDEESASWRNEDDSSNADGNKTYICEILNSPLGGQGHMQLTNRAKQVNRKPMTFLESIYLWNILKGMGITISHLFKKKATICYPEQTRTFSKVFRGLHVLNRDAEGRENEYVTSRQSKNGARTSTPCAMDSRSKSLKFVGKSA